MAINEAVNEQSLENIDDSVVIKETIKQFYEIYKRISEQEGDDRPSRKAVSEMKAMNAILFPSKQVGNLPGVHIGYEFLTRGIMAAVGFHSHGFKEVDYGFQHDFVAHEEYRGLVFPLATSVVVLSAEYKKEVVYISRSDGDFEDRNLALKNNEEQGIPVRLIRKHVDERFEKLYTYDGLYNVVRSYSEEGSSSLMYRLKRLEEQSLTINQDRFLGGHPFGDIDAITCLCSRDITVVDPERIPIIATNEVDYEPYSSTNFIYSKSVIFAENVKKPKKTRGCNCVGSCTDSEKCPCTKPNGSYPYLSEEDSRLTRSDRQVIYECGEHCGCGSRCRNRITQRELQHHLEVFRTQQKGWGVRCRDPIAKGAYLGEYVGEIRRDKDVEKEPDNMYLFDIDAYEKGRRRTAAKYCIDGSRTGNFVRFINHSCDPNLVIQSVLSAHRDIKLARIVFFAHKDIPAEQELTYDYGDGYIKMMKCHCVCGAKKCKRPPT